MNATVSVTLPNPTLIRLMEFLHRRGGRQDVSEAVAEAVELWLKQQLEHPGKPAPDGVHGYQWKSLFLPDGTVLRTTSYGRENYARVAGNRIVYEGQAVSPNQFARLSTHTTRNAWHDIFVRRPGDKYLRQADLLRREAQQESPLPPKPPMPATMAETPPAPDQPARNVAAGPGWDLPERRKMRFRLEDVAFD